MKKTLRRETTDGIVQELKYNEFEHEYDLLTTIKGDDKYIVCRSFLWVDVSKREPMFEDELAKARFYKKAKLPSKSELLYKKLGFTEVNS